MSLASSVCRSLVVGLVLIFFLPIQSSAQTGKKLTWKVMSKMEFEEIYNEEYGFKVPYPIFNDKVKALEGQIVIVEGYIIPLEVGDDHGLLVLSKFPESTCFFCGMAGPETIIDVIPKIKVKNKALNIGGKMTFKGRLKLNRDDLDHMNYMLMDAEIVK